MFREDYIENFPAMINLENTSNSSRLVSFDSTPLTESDFAVGLGYEYGISVSIEPYRLGAFVVQDSIRATLTLEKRALWEYLIFLRDQQHFLYENTAFVAPNISATTATVTFRCVDSSVEAPPNPFLIKGRKYNCFDLFRRAMLTTDTRIINNAHLGLDERYDNKFNDIGIQYPIEVHGDWIQRLKETVMFESVFENKNLWEVMQQIGYYLHAIPYLEFARNGKDRFVLRFKQLGGKNYGSDGSIRITVFNSQTLDNFFTQYDSYVTNMFSPQNEVEEWLVCKTSDSSFLVSNNTAELHTKYNITELVAFDIYYPGVAEPKSALEFVFEKSVYDILSARTDFIPAKWASLYFQMGTSKILGLNYVPPTVNNDGYMALKTIVGRLFTNRVSDPKLKFNDLMFRVRYKTQDALRINQLRPDLERFMKSSEYENYPHHEQFFGQQDKIVDSERFSANLWGRLIRVANGIYQCQEYAPQGQEKVPGDLFNLMGSSYYVTECENEYYPDAVLQKVTYSRNFNQLSNIVTIPSEPRFFEISERSMIRREVRMLDFIKLSSLPNDGAPPPRFINQSKWHGLIRDLLFADNGNPQLPNFAYVNYKADIWRNHEGLPNNNTSVMFPSSEATETGGLAQPLPSKPNRAAIVPVLYFPLRNAIVFEWDMDDNFKAGDSVDASVESPPFSDIPANLGKHDEAYYALQPVRSTDVFGRADLFDFKLFARGGWTMAQARRLPFAEENDVRPTAAESIILIPDELSVGLDKDNREALSFNYQLNLLHEPHDEDAEDFVVFSNLFGVKNNRLKAALLRNEVSMLDEAVRLDAGTIIPGADDVQYAFENLTNSIRIDFTPPTGIEENIADVKSIVLYDTENTANYAYIAKNVALLPSERKLQSWFIYPVFSA